MTEAEASGSHLPCQDFVASVVDATLSFEPYLHSDGTVCRIARHPG